MRLFWRRPRQPADPFADDDLDLEDLGITIEFEFNDGGRGEDPPWLVRLDQSPPEGFTRRLAESVKVVGVQRRRRQVEAFVSGRDQRITLQREPDNPADPNAIKVIGTWTDDAGRRHTAELGYLPREEAAKIADTARDKPLAATIQKMFLPREEKSPGLRLDIWTVGEAATLGAASLAGSSRETSDSGGQQQASLGCGCCGCLTILAVLVLVLLLTS